MKNWRKVLSVVLVLAMAVSLVACGGSGTSSTSSTSSAASESSASESSTVEESSEAASSEASTSETTTTESTPRNETMYFGGMQWGKPIDLNPFSASSNNFFMDQSDSSRVLVYESLYMYNMLNGEVYPLLADGDMVVSDDQKTITVKIKAAAKWSDGTPVTANDVAYTFDCHVKYQSNSGVDYSQYIKSVVATDDSTVVFTANDDNFNPLKVKEYIPKMYVAQKAYLQSIEEKVGEDAEKFKTEPMWDAPHSGPYDFTLGTEEKVVATRNDSYWGQDASMWGKLPVPKYLVHNIYSGNDTSAVAFENGEIDMNQQFMSNIWKYWEDKNLPISTYIDQAPYFVGASMPSCWFNCTKEGLDQKAVRQAIAYAVDYDQIIASAMSGYSASFTDVPRSLFNPTDGEQAILANIESDLKDLQWSGKDVDKANKVLDDAGITDSNGDGVREYNGTELSFKVECPTGWTDWNAALDIVAAAGKEIGINLETYYPEATVWTEDMQTGNFDIAMNTAPAASISNPWQRAYVTMYGWGGKFPDRLTVGYSRWYNEEADKALAELPTTTDETKLNELYTTLNKLYLEEVPSFALMYRPAMFHEVNESVWTGFPEKDDGTDIPPMCCVNGYGVAALYNLSLVNG